MAHVEKFKAHQVAPLMRHNLRKNSNYSNGNIDHGRTPLNYLLGDVADPLELMHAKLRDLPKKPRKDAVVLFCWVVTAPKDLKEGDNGEFFESVFSFLCARYGKENLICASIHRDETTDHGHFSFVPLTADGRLCAKEVLNRSELRAFHKDLSSWVERDLGYRVSVELDESKKIEKSLSGASQDEYKSAMEAISEASERLERLRGNEVESVAEIERLASGVREAERRRDSLAFRVRSLGERLEDLVRLLEKSLSPIQLLRRVKSSIGDLSGTPIKSPKGRGREDREL